MSAPPVERCAADLLHVVGEVCDQLAQGDVEQALKIWAQPLVSGEDLTAAPYEVLTLRDQLYLPPPAAIACRCGRALQPYDIGDRGGSIWSTRMHWASDPHVAESDETVVLPPIVCGVCFIGGQVW